jgi:NAD(P) transhydrogenase subunit alpha
VALVPEAVAKLKASGIDVVLERGAGIAASFPDEAYGEAGAEIADEVWGADGVVKVHKPNAEELQRLGEGQLLVGFLEPLTDAAGIETLTQRGVIGFAMESIPRISRAQAMDALSS